MEYIHPLETVSSYEDYLEMTGKDVFDEYDPAEEHVLEEILEQQLVENENNKES